MTPISILLVEDHHLVREALRALIEEGHHFAVVGQAEDGNQALQMAEKLHPNVVVMDIMMPHLNGLEATSRLRALHYPPKVIILSQHHAQEYIVQALMVGASGYLLKDAAADELPTAIRAVIEGTTYLSSQIPRDAIEESLLRRDNAESPFLRLTPREREVLQLVAEGNTNRQIAHYLGISIKTVEKHRFSLMDKLGIRDVTGLVRFAIAHGIIEGDDGELSLE
ncbi:MAG: response regulator transcription factor [Anaerolineae bacterium]|nr:response regulator transcription factor [Anaerolineae bacterium]